MDEPEAPGPDGGFRAADAAWRQTLARYITLARQGASRRTLREAATAVHEAARRRGHLAAHTPDEEP